MPPILIRNYPDYTPATDPNFPPNGTGLDDFDVEFGYNVTNDGVGYSPEMVLNGWTNALKMTVNKYPNIQASAGVNVYPVGRSFSGNYAMRFSMNLSEGNAAGTTEYDIFGINHHGTNCNWFAEDIQAGTGGQTYAGSYETNQDGIWYWIDADTDGIGTYGYAQVYGPPLPNNTFDVAQHFPANTAPFTNYFKNPVPYNVSAAGTPVDGYGMPANTWADVEVKQVNNVVTLSINKFPIMTYLNTTNASSGDIMLGYDDPYANVGSVGNTVANGGPPFYPGAAVYYSNVRVVQLTPPNVTTASLSGTTMTINFTDSDTDDTSSSFKLLASSTVNGTYAPVTATFSQLPSGAWQAAVTVPNGTTAQFYQVVRI